MAAPRPLPKHQQGALLQNQCPELLPARDQGHVTSPSGTSNTLPHCIVYQDLDSEIQMQTEFVQKDIDGEPDCEPQSQHEGMPDYRPLPPLLPPKLWQGVPQQHLSPEPLLSVAAAHSRRLQLDGHGEAGLDPRED